MNRKKELYLIGQDNTIYKFSVQISLSSKGQNKSKLQKQRSNIFIWISYVMNQHFLISNICNTVMYFIQGFEVTPKLWELARFVHDRNIQTFVLQELQKSSGLAGDQSALLAYLQQLFDHYPCSSFSVALLSKSNTAQRWFS